MVFSSLFSQAASLQRETVNNSGWLICDRVPFCSLFIYLLDLSTPVWPVVESPNNLATFFL